MTTARSPIWLGAFGDAVFLAAFSQQNVTRALGAYGTVRVTPLPKARGLEPMGKRHAHSKA